MKKNVDRKTLANIVRRAHYMATNMVYLANNRGDKEKGDPKIGGHASACASAVHIMGALHLLVKTGFDHIANKPHASPTDHSYNYLLDLFLKKDLSKLSLEEANTAMAGLRAFPQHGEYVFQSYHSAYDPDHHNFFPSGTVGIPQVKAGYLALAYEFARSHGYEVPDAHFWAVMGDSEFREGSVFEAVPDFAEREIGNLTWIVDYNRQSLDGHRITNKEIMGGPDNTRIARTMAANGWHVIELRHGNKRLAAFKKDGGKELQTWLEEGLSDYELQSMLLVKDHKLLREHIIKENSKLNKFLDKVSDQELYEIIHDFGGHDIEALAKAMLETKEETRRPSIIIAHTIKGWELDAQATPGNHNTLPSLDEVKKLREQAGIKEDLNFARFEADSKEGAFLKARGDSLYKDIKAQNALKQKNQESFLNDIEKNGGIPHSLDINLKMASYPHTQWMLGQLTSKLTRIANTPLTGTKEKQKALTESERGWKLPAELMVEMAPDVGTSTNLNPSMDGKIFGTEVEDYEAELHVKDVKTPDLVPGENVDDRFLRFEIVEANTMSCMGSFGRLRDTLGIPILPLMTIYDFFVKRALDQYFYNLYWKSSFILVGTPSGVSLSPEGAQHGWKSDIQIPNQITWEPFYCVELDWILSDAIRRHVLDDNEGRTGVHIRGVTRGVEQKDLIKLLRTHKKYKQEASSDQWLHHKDHPMQNAIDESSVNAISDEEILADMKKNVLCGGYYLIDYRGYAGYEPGDNVVNIFSLGVMGVEAIHASHELLQKGIYANVIVVTSPDLLIGNLAHENDYRHLRQTLGVKGDLYLQPLSNGGMVSSDLVTLAGRRIPIVSVHDGEPGLLDNLGSIVGVKQEALAVRKHSRCGRPRDVYQFHGIDWASIVEAAGKVMSETALEEIQVSRRILEQAQRPSQTQGDWTQLWPQQHRG